MREDTVNDVLSIGEGSVKADCGLAPGERQAAIGGQTSRSSTAARIACSMMNL
jgi:hypothetical protein